MLVILNICDRILSEKLIFSSFSTLLSPAKPALLGPWVMDAKHN